MVPFAWDARHVLFPSAHLVADGFIWRRWFVMIENRKTDTETDLPNNSQPANMMKRSVSTVRLHLWLESSEGLVFCLGRALLLPKIEEHGSPRKAAEELGMSYRAAWGKIRKTEKVLGMKLSAQNRSRKEGNHLTEEGMMLEGRYHYWLHEVEKRALKKAREIFELPVQGHRQES
jgi:molybdate transport system regulatory protein